MALALARQRKTSEGAPSADIRSPTETACVLLAFMGLGYALLHSGGRTETSTTVALVLAAPSLLAGQVWRTVPQIEKIAAGLVGLAAVLVALVTPLGVSHAGDLGAYTYAAVLFLAIRGYARNEERRRLCVVAFISLAIVEFPDVWRVWIGERSRSFQMVGTFYWHNQFGIYAAATALIATAMAMRSRRMEDGIAALVAPLCLALTLLSRSRGAQLSLVIGGAALLAVVVVQRQWRAAVRLVVVSGLAVATYLAFMAASEAGQSSVPVLATPNGSTTAPETAAAAAHFRHVVLDASVHMFAQAPVASHGYGSLAVEGWKWTPVGQNPAAWAHSAELQAFTDGGLLLGLPVLLVLGLTTLLALRTIGQSARSPAFDWVRAGAAASLLAMLVHTSMDFDSQYPVLTALMAVLVALALPARPSSSRSLRSRALATSALGVVTLSALLGAMLVSSYWDTTDELNSAATAMANDSAHGIAIARHALEHHAFTDPRPASFIVEATALGFTPDDSTLHLALQESRGYARLDPVFARTWAEVSRTQLAASPPTTPTTTDP